MNDIETTRLTLHAVDEAEARRIHGREPSADDRWAEDYPFEGDLAALGSLLLTVDRHGEQRPFGYYRITRRSDGLAVGGVGFKGRPEDGAVEIGYGVAPSARGHRYVGEALVAVMELAHAHGVTLIRADTTPDNVPSRRVLERAGFDQVAADDELVRYETRLG